MKKSKKVSIKIGVFTSTRADYGLLRPLLKRIQSDEVLELSLFVTGMHLSREHGYTYRNIEDEGFQEVTLIPIKNKAGNDIDTCKGMSSGFEKFSDALARKKIDTMILLGDRFETFVMASVCHVMKIPICHIHGGEKTQGAYDDAFRHSITKMSYAHFTSSEGHRKRVVQMGEEPNRVFNVGALGIENILSLEIVKKKMIESDLEFNLGEKYAVATCHPETLRTGNLEYIDEMIGALKNFQDLKVIFTASNCDGGGDEINHKIRKLTEEYPDRYKFVESLGMKRYFSVVRESRFVIGNSSSGVLEVPALKRPVINIGDRQKGRVESKHIINVPWKSENIKVEIEKLLKIEKQLAISEETQFGDGDTSKMICMHLKQIFGAGEVDLAKDFYDLEW